jgi:hypothetical protein
MSIDLFLRREGSAHHPGTGEPSPPYEKPSHCIGYRCASRQGRIFLSSPPYAADFERWRARAGPASVRRKAWGDAGRETKPLVICGELDVLSD